MSEATSYGPQMSMAEYFRREQFTDVKHDYIAGHAVAMAGGSPRHSLVSANVTGEVRNKLGKKPCKVYDSNLLVGVPGTPYSHYPDAAIVCGPLQFDPRDPGQNTIVNPRVVFEVLSPSTAASDRGDKFDRYRTLESFNEYVLVFQNKPEIQTFFKHPDGTWLMRVAHGVKAKIKLQSVGITLDAAEIYRGVAFDPPEETDVMGS
jgi:Uma2 family endonuclease